MAVLGVPMLLGPITGPILGGWLIDAASWHWIFLINVPIGAASLVYAFLALPQDEGAKAPAPLSLPSAPSGGGASNGAVAAGAGGGAPAGKPGAPAAVMVPAAGLPICVLGLLNCGVLVALSASARTSTPIRSVKLMRFPNAASRLKKSGPAKA